MRIRESKKEHSVHFKTEELAKKAAQKLANEMDSVVSVCRSVKMRHFYIEPGYAKDNLIAVAPEQASTEGQKYIRDQWEGMPAFIQNDKRAFKQIIVNFKDKESFLKFAKVMNQPMLLTTKSIWYPHKPNEVLSDKVWISKK